MDAGNDEIDECGDEGAVDRRAAEQQPVMDRPVRRVHGHLQVHRCPHLTADNLCGIYERRPAICRAYQADELCARIAAPTLDERVRNYLAEFGLLREARAAAGARSMRAVRSLPVLP